MLKQIAANLEVTIFDKSSSLHIDSDNISDRQEAQDDISYNSI